MHNAKYMSARANDGRIVSISEVPKTGREALGPFICPGFENPMTAALGKKNVKHFRHTHQQETPCSFESYMHRSAKQIVWRAIEEALAEGRT